MQFTRQLSLVLSLLALCNGYLLPLRSMRSSFLKQSTKLQAGNVPIELVKELRGISGAPIGDCKKALEENNCDTTKALEYLRMKGIVKVANRVTKEGMLAVYKTKENDRHRITLLEMNCETDFVTLNKDFQQYVKYAVQTIHENAKANNLLGDLPIDQLLKFKAISNKLHCEDAKYESVEKGLQDMIGAIRENIVIRRAATFEEERSEDTMGVLSFYVHKKLVAETVTEDSITTLGKTATVVELQAKKLNSAVDLLGRYNDLNDILGKKTAMHVLASKPVFLSTADAGAEYIDSEKRVLKEQTKVEMLNKNRAVNDEMLEKIVAGKINKQLTEISLLSQPHANNPLMAAGEASEMTVEDVLSNYAKVHFNNEISLAIKSFHNWMLVK